MLQDFSSELGGLPPYDFAGNCTPDDSFAHIRFTDSELVRSNLGGQGGRCATTADCTEACSSCAGIPCTAAECVGMTNEIYIKNIGLNGVCACVSVGVCQVSALHPPAHAALLT